MTVARILAEIKSDKYRAKSMGKEGFNQLQDRQKTAVLRLVLLSALSEARGLNQIGDRALGPKC